MLQLGSVVQLQNAATVSRMGILFRSHLQRRETWSGVLLSRNVALQPQAQAF